MASSPARCRWQGVRGTISPSPMSPHSRQVVGTTLPHSPWLARAPLLKSALLCCPGNEQGPFSWVLLLVKNRASPLLSRPRASSLLSRPRASSPALTTQGQVSCLLQVVRGKGRVGYLLSLPCLSHCKGDKWQGQLSEVLKLPRDRDSFFAGMSSGPILP